jgi:hypothetical protein
VHFGEESLSPVWHPDLNSNVDPHVLRWGADMATEAVDLLLDVVATWADHPSKLTTQWSEAYEPSVRGLKELRGSY